MEKREEDPDMGEHARKVLAGQEFFPGDLLPKRRFAKMPLFPPGTPESEIEVNTEVRAR